MRHWMKRLAEHYARRRAEAPERTLVLVTDIDGTILDMRHMVTRVLKRYDREHGTTHFRRLQASSVGTHENQVHQWLLEFGLDSSDADRVHGWYLKKRWDTEAIVAMHAPFRGVLEVLRWFQLQPQTEIALLTGRPDSLRKETLRCLQALGKPHRVDFCDELLFMNPGVWEERVSHSKTLGIEQLRNRGLEPFAFIDNEPSNLEAVASIDPDKEILLLHADTIFETQRGQMPSRAIGGSDYQVAELLEDDSALPSRVELVWHGANDRRTLEKAADARVHWVEMDVRMAPTLHQPIVRAAPLEETPWGEEETPLHLITALELAQASDKGVKLDIKGDQELLAAVIETLTEAHGRAKLWFNARLEDIRPDGFATLRRAFPDAVLQCPADWLVPFIFADPPTASQLADRVRDWGIDRFSFVWDKKRVGVVVDFMESRGHQTNLYRVPDLEAFLHAALLLPSSITTPFDAAKELGSA